jgi:hypothetical protein
MQAIMMYFWRLCLLRESPERIPPSPNLAIAATALYFIVGLLSFGVSRELAFTTIVGVSCLSIIIEGAGLYGLLFFKNYWQRFLPTLIALFSCNTLFLVALLPVNYLLGNLDAQSTSSNIINTLSLLTLFWWFAIVGFILKKAADISIFQGIVLAFVIELLVAIAIRSAFSEFA